MVLVLLRARKDLMPLPILPTNCRAAILRIIPSTKGTSFIVGDDEGVVAEGGVAFVYFGWIFSSFSPLLFPAFFSF